MRMVIDGRNCRNEDAKQEQFVGEGVHLLVGNAILGRNLSVEFANFIDDILADEKAHLACACPVDTFSRRSAWADERLGEDNAIVNDMVRSAAHWERRARRSLRISCLAFSSS